MKDPDDSQNYFPENEKNVEMYNNYKKDRLTYIEIAKAMTFSQPNIEKPDKVEPLDSIDLQYQIEFDRIEDNNKKDKFILLNQSGEVEDDEAIFRRKMKALQMTKEEQGPVFPQKTSL